MTTSLTNDDMQNEHAAFIAIDWADQKHAFSLQVAGQNKRQTGTLEQKPEVIGPWVAELLCGSGSLPSEAPAVLRAALGVALAG